jgi:mRNA-decapping enzyme 1B
VYSRVAEPFYSIFINNRLNTNSLVEPITKPIELQSQPPFLLYRNQRQAISGFWFYCKEDCVRIYALLEKLIKKATGSNANHNPHNISANSVKSEPHHHHHHHQQQQQPPQQQQQQPINIHQNLTNGGGKQEVDIFSMLSKAQAEFNHSNGPPPFAASVESQFAEMKINQQKQQQQQQKQQHQPLMKQLSSAMPDITSPNVVNFFAAAQHPNGVSVIEGAHPHGPSHFVPTASNPIVAPVQTLDEIEKQHRVSSISPKAVGTYASLSLSTLSQNTHSRLSNFSEQKLLNNLLHSAAANSCAQQQQQPPPKLPLAGVIQQQHSMPQKPTLITPAMFQAPPSIEDKSPGIAASSNHHRPEPLTQNQLIQALNYLLENDPDFIQKIHEAYIKSFSKKISL